VSTFFEKMATYMQFMSVLNMTPEQVEQDPQAMETLLRIRDMINADPHNEVCEGLRPQVERLLGPQDWKDGEQNV